MHRNKTIDFKMPFRSWRRHFFIYYYIKCCIIIFVRSDKSVFFSVGVIKSAYYLDFAFLRLVFDRTFVRRRLLLRPFFRDTFLVRRWLPPSDLETDTLFSSESDDNNKAGPPLLDEPYEDVLITDDAGDSNAILDDGDADGDGENDCDE